MPCEVSADDGLTGVPIGMVLLELMAHAITTELHLSEDRSKAPLIVLYDITTATTADLSHTEYIHYV